MSCLIIIYLLINVFCFTFISNEFSVFPQQSSTTEDTKEVKTEVFIMIGLIAALAIILVATTTSLVCIRRK